VCLTRVCTYRESTIRYRNVHTVTNKPQQKHTELEVIPHQLSQFTHQLTQYRCQYRVNRRLETAPPKHAIKIVYHARILYNSVQFCTILYNSVQFSGIRYVAVLSVKRAQYNFLLDNREIAQLS